MVAISIWLFLLLLVGIPASVAFVVLLVKRPAVGIAVGLVGFIVIGLMFALLLGTRQVAVSDVHYEQPMVSQYPTISQPVDPVMSFPTQSVSHQSYFRIAFFPLLSIGVLVLVGGAALIARWQNSHGDGHRRSAWPVFLLIPAVAALTIVFWGYSQMQSVRQDFGGVPRLEALPQDFGHDFSVSHEINQSQGLAQEHAIRAQAEVARIQEQIAEQKRKQQADLAEAKRRQTEVIAESRRRHNEAITDGKRRADAAMAESQRKAEQNHDENMRRLTERHEQAMSALVKAQFANADIHALMDLFDRPRIELAEKSAETAEATVENTAAAASASAVVLEHEESVKDAKSAVDHGAVAVSEGKGEAQAAKPSAGQGPKQERRRESREKAAGEAQIKKRLVESEAALASVESATKETHKPADKAPALPSWLNDQPGMVGQDYREVIATDEYARAEEARRAMDVYLMLKTAERVKAITGRQFVESHRPSVTFHQGTIMADGQVIDYGQQPVYGYDDRIRLLHQMGVGMEQIRRSVVREQYMAERDSPRALGKMYKQYTLAQFTPWFDDQLKKHYRSYLRRERFAVVGVGTGSVLGLLCFVFGLLKVDTWTKGYYTKRLFIGVPAMIIGGVTLLAIIGSMM